MGIDQVPGIFWTVDFVLTSILLVPLILRWRSMAMTYVIYAGTVAVVALSFTPPGEPLMSDSRLLLILFRASRAMALVLGRRGYAATVIVFVLVGYACAASVFMNWGCISLVGAMQDRGSRCRSPRPPPAVDAADVC